MATSVNQFTLAGGEVTVSIPSSVTPRLRAVALDIGSVEMLPITGFRPVRLVANVVIEQQSQPGIYLTSLPAAVKIKVKYRAADRQAAGTKPLVLAFWDGTAWVPFTNAKHAFKLTAYADLSKGGYATVSITKWGDPPISWGT